MKHVILCGLLVGQAILSSPAFAAGPGEWTAGHAGAFGGVRVRLPLGGRAEERTVRAGLAVAPALAVDAGRGNARMGIGEGILLGYGAGEPLVTVAGRDVRRLGAQDDGVRDERRGLPTWAWIVGGVLVATGVGVLLLDDALDDASE